jgi:ribonuclease D
MSITTGSHVDAPVLVMRGDIDASTFERLSASPMLSWDIETTGLDWRSDRIATVQLHDKGLVVLAQQLDDEPQLLRRLLEADEIPKLFHHAMFDLRFMASAWGAAPGNVACTKIAAKLLGVPHAQQSLAPLVGRYLGVALDKSRQASEWMSASLSVEQLAYAAGDVCYLEDLMAALRNELESGGRWPLAEACFAHLPTRVALEVGEYDDVYVY